ncbi:MAG TPA: glutamine synthetase family protein [Acidimicrobiia bacterium]|nr:glutamine synthetase family protein [Acidimicrobiia bacterium]
MTARGMLDAAQLEQHIDSGEIDTVLVAFADLQGRLVGKRVTGSYWRDHMRGGAEPLHMCNYLLAVDSEMNVLPGYAFASWDQGYGDMAAQPDLATIRRVPWLDKTALVLCDLLDEETGAPVEVSPRRILQRQVEQAAAAGFSLNFASELEFFLFRDSLEEAAAKGYADLTPHSLVVEDYHILQTTRDEYLIRDIRNGIDGAGVPVEFSKGEAGRGQHEINLVYADPVEMADRHVIYKNGAKEIAAQHGRAITFMAKYSADEVGSSCHVHSSLWSRDGEDALMWDPGAPDHLSPVFRGWLGGQIACGRELAWMYAPTVNSYKRYQPESWAPTALAWSIDNRTCGFRIVGHGSSFRLESRIPGADVNPYLAYAATIAAGLHGVEHGIDPGARFDGNAYAAPELARVPESLVAAIDAFASSKVAVDAFGAEVHDHLLNTARQEWAYFNRAVTDWERRRNFDQW